jgi:hypothetical protein
MTDQVTLTGQVIVGLIALLIQGFIIYRVIQAIAAFVDGLEGRPERSSAPETQDEDEEEE